MDSLRDSLQNHQKTVTLSGAQVDFLMRVNARAQEMLNQFQEAVASEYLHQLAVTQFGMNPNKDFHFEFHPEKEADNLTITERIDRKG